MEGRNATQKPMQISQRVMEGRMPSPNPTREHSQRPVSGRDRSSRIQLESTHRGLCLAAIEAAP